MIFFLSLKICCSPKFLPKWSNLSEDNLIQVLVLISTSFAGIQTSEDARFYALSRKFKPFATEGKDLVVQFTVKHEQNIDCGGGYVKVFDCSLNQEDMHGESPYRLMFGPDICGPGTKKVHVILNYKDKNVLINKDIRCKVNKRSINFSDLCWTCVWM